jgi:hypothetical protein
LDDKIPEPEQDIADDLGVEAVHSTSTEEKISESNDQEVHAVIRGNKVDDKCTTKKFAMPFFAMVVL